MMDYLVTFPRKRRPPAVKALGISLSLTVLIGAMGTLVAYIPDLQPTILSLVMAWGLSIVIGVAGFWNARRPHWVAVFIVYFSLTTLFLAGAIHMVGPYLSGWPWILVLMWAYLFVWVLPLFEPRLAKVLSDEQSRPRTWLGRHQVSIVFSIVIISAIVIGILSHRPLESINPAMLFIGTLFSFLAVGAGQYFAYQVRKDWKKQVQQAAGDPAANRKASEFFEAGFSKLETGDFEAAIEEFSKVVEVQPEFLDAYLFRGVACFNLSQYERAISDWDRIVQKDPEHHVAYFNRSAARMQLEQTDLALADIDQAIQLEPTNPRCYIQRAVIQLFRVAYDSALEDAARAIEFGAAKAGHSLRASIFEENLGDLPSAITEWTRILKIDPKNGWAYCSRGILWAATGDRKRAIRDLQKGLRHKKELPDSVREEAEQKLQELKEAA